MASDEVGCRGGKSGCDAVSGLPYSWLFGSWGGIFNVMRSSVGGEFLGTLATNVSEFVGDYVAVEGFGFFEDGAVDECDVRFGVGKGRVGASPSFCFANGDIPRFVGTDNDPAVILWN